MNVFYHPFTFISQVCSLKLCKLSYLPIVFSQLLLDANYFLQSISLAVLIYWYSESATEHAALIIVFYCWCNHFFSYWKSWIVCLSVMKHLFAMSCIYPSQSRSCSSYFFMFFDSLSSHPSSFKGSSFLVKTVDKNELSLFYILWWLPFVEV